MLENQIELQILFIVYVNFYKNRIEDDSNDE